MGLEGKERYWGGNNVTDEEGRLILVTKEEVSQGTGLKAGERYWAGSNVTDNDGRLVCVGPGGAEIEEVVAAPTENATTDTANAQAALKAAGETAHGVVSFTEPGVYHINEELVRPHATSIIIGPTTVLLAVAEMTNLLSDSPTEKTEYRSIIGGGRLASNNLAKHALWCRYFNHITIGVQCDNSLEDDVVLGDNVTPATAASVEPVMLPQFWVNRTAGSVPLGHACLHAERASDGRAFGNVLKGQEIGLKLDSASTGWMTYGIHPYGAAYPMQVCIDDNTQSQHVNPVVDDPTPKAHTATGSNSNNTITDAEILAVHEGRPLIAGGNIPAGTFVGTVTPGTSFLLVNKLGEEVKPTGSVTTITLAAVGILCRAPWFTIVGGIVYANATYATDNTVYGIVCGKGVTAGGVISNFTARGASASFRVAKAITGRTETVNWSNLTEIECVTAMSPLMQENPKSALPIEAYRTIFENGGRYTAEAAAGTKFPVNNTNFNTQGGNLGTTQYVRLCDIYAADYPAVAGRTAKLRLVSKLACSATAPGTMTFIAGLYPVTIGGATTNMTYSTGTVVTGSTATHTNPEGSKSVRAVSGDFELPTDGQYVVAVVTNATIAANSQIAMDFEVQVHYV